MSALSLSPEWWDNVDERQLVLRYNLLPVILGTLFSFIYLGLILLLVSRYFTLYKLKDRLWARALVLSCLLFSVLDSVTSGVWMVQWCMGYGEDVQILVKMHKGLGFYTIIVGFSVWTTDCFFVGRLYLIGQRRALPLIAVIAGLSSAAAGIGYWWIIHAFHSTSIFDFLSDRPKVVAYLLCTVFADLGITAGILFFLVFEPKRATDGVVKTNGRILALALQAVEVNAVSLTVHITLLIMVLAATPGLSYLIVAFLIPKSYLASTLATILTRPKPSFSPPSSSSPHQITLSTFGGQTPANWRQQQQPRTVDTTGRHRPRPRLQPSSSVGLVTMLEESDVGSGGGVEYSRSVSVCVEHDLERELEKGHRHHDDDGSVFTSSPSTVSTLTENGDLSSHRARRGSVDGGVGAPAYSPRPLPQPRAEEQEEQSTWTGLQSFHLPPLDAPEGAFESRNNWNRGG